MSNWPKKAEAAPAVTGQALLDRIHFVDIEVVSQEQYLMNDDYFKKRFDWLWQKGGKQWEEIYQEHAGLLAEHGKIVNISLGKMVSGKFFVKSYTGTDEKQILADASVPLMTANCLCAHNGQEFDYPYYTRRCIINNLPIPPILNTFGKKPWDVADQLYDTMKMWSHTAWNYRCSADLMCHALGIPSSKQDIDGSKINDVYYGNGEYATMTEETRLQAIGRYGIADVIALARIYCRLRGIETIRDEQITYA
jgi:3'-5' exonuclease